MDRKRQTILDLMEDPQWFAQFFHGESWTTWKRFLRALFGLKLADSEIATFNKHTGRHLSSDRAAREAYAIVGRRGGKSRIAALVAVYLACFHDYRPILAAGERGTVMVIAADRRQARVVLSYIIGLMEANSILDRLVRAKTKESITLNNGIMIEVHTADFRTTRGYTVVAAICDEVAFWRSENSANPDVEILNALRPGMLTVPGALLLCISSPYARRGVLWDAFQRHFAKEGDPIFVWQADTQTMNPMVDEDLIRRAYEQDGAAASAEYGALFRRDIEGLLAREAVDSVVVLDRYELPPFPSEFSYGAFVDPSGGSQDSMTLAIAHRDDEQIVLDLVRERRPPFSPEDVVKEFADLVRRYDADSVRGDRYGGEWVSQSFQREGISYETAEKSKGDLYRELVPLINSRRVELLDNPGLIAQLCRLERRTARGGRDTIDHPPAEHDDLANAVAGAIVQVAEAVSAGVEMW